MKRTLVVSKHCLTSGNDRFTTFHWNRTLRVLFQRNLIGLISERTIDGAVAIKKES